MSDWLETAPPTSGNDIRNAAIDGHDWRLASLALLADPASICLPRAILDDLTRIAFAERAISDIETRKVRAVADYLDKQVARV